MLSWVKSFSSNIHYNYSVASKATFQCGCWSVYDAKNRSSKEPVSVWVVDKKSIQDALSSQGIRPRSAIVGQVLEHAQRGAANLTKLRHPAILKVVEALESSRTSLSFVTERVQASLSLFIRTEDDEMNDLMIVRGFSTLCSALEFLHNQVGYVHMNLSPETVLIDAKGDWKLAGLEFIELFQEHSAGDFFLPNVDPRFPAWMMPSVDYLSPELVISHTILPANDMWSIACLLYASYNHGKAPLATRNNPNAYKEELQRLKRRLLSAHFPSSLQPLLISLFAEDPNERLTLASFQQSEFFQNPLIKALASMDVYPTMTPPEKISYLKHLISLIPQFPKVVRQQKMLNFGREQLEGPRDPATGALIAGVIFEASREMSRLGFSEEVLPLFKTFSDYAPFQEAVSSHIDVVVESTSDKDFSKHVVPTFVNALKDSANAASHPVQTQILRQAPSYMSQVTIPVLEQSLFPEVIDCFAATPARSVKVACVRCSCEMVKRGLSKTLIMDRLMPALEAMKTRDPAVVLSVRELYEAVTPKIGTSVLVEKVIPHLLVMSISDTLTQDQFKVMLAEVRAEIDRVEERQLEELRKKSTSQNESKEFGESLEGDGTSLHQEGSNKTVGFPGKDSWSKKPSTDSIGGTNAKTSKNFISAMPSPMSNAPSQSPSYSLQPQVLPLEPPKSSQPPQKAPAVDTRWNLSSATAEKPVIPQFATLQPQRVSSGPPASGMGASLPMLNPGAFQAPKPHERIGTPIVPTSQKQGLDKFESLL